MLATDLNLGGISRILVVVSLIALIFAVAAAVSYLGGFKGVGSLEAPSSSSNVTSIITTTATTTSSSRRTLIQSAREPIPALTFDSYNGYVYASSGNGLLAVNSSNQVVGNVSLGFGPSSIAYEPSNHLIYATSELFRASLFDPSSQNITSLNFKENETYMTAPSAEGYNPTLNVYYVPSVEGFDIVNGTSDKLESFVNLGSGINGIAYDAANGMIYMANGGYVNHSASIYVAKSGTNTLVTNITAGKMFGPGAITIDSYNGYLYVANLGLNSYEPPTTMFPSESNVTIIDTKTNAIIKTISIGNVLPANIIYVPRDNQIYLLSMIAGGGGANILGIKDKTNAIDFNSTISYSTIGVPTSIVYDPLNTCIFVGGEPTANGSSRSMNIVTIPAL